MASEQVALHAVVRGRVQGVSFRYYTQRQAAALGLVGYVRNLPGGDAVEVVAEGEKESVEEMLAWLRHGPRGARVEDVDLEWLHPAGEYRDFGVRF